MSIANGRDSNGRFAKGNPGGPGNPYVVRVGALREAFLGAVTENDLRAVVRKLVARPPTRGTTQRSCATSARSGH